MLSCSRTRTGKEEDVLYPICVDSRGGYIDKYGKETIKPKYDYVSAFAEGYAFVCEKGKWKCIDVYGNIHFSTPYQLLSNYTFKKGMLEVADTNIEGIYKGLVLDTLGNVRLRLDTLGLDVCNFGFGICWTDKNIYSIKRKKFWDYHLNIEACDNNWLVATNGDSLFVFDDNENMLFMYPSKLKSLFILGQETVVINGNYFNRVGELFKVSDSLNYFYKDAVFFENMAGFTKYIEGGIKKMGYINKSFQEVISPTYNDILVFSEGLAAVQDTENSLWKFIDTDGKTVINPIFKSVLSSFNKDLALGIFADGSYGYINKGGEIIWKGQCYKPPYKLIRGLTLHYPYVRVGG